MRKEFLVALSLIAFIFGSVGMASAGLITWKILQHSSIGGDGPYSDNVLGHGTDSHYPPDTYEKNTCNLTGIANCATTASDPASGSYSFVAMDLKHDKTCGYLHDDPNGGKTCTDASQCPGAELGCLDCSDGKIGWSNGYDTYSYFGNTSALGTGVFYTCQQSGNDMTFTRMDIGTSESIPPLGFGCLNLASTGGGSGTTPCGAGPWTSTLNVAIKVALCVVTGGTVPGISLNGRVYEVGQPVPAVTHPCNYNSTEIGNLLSKVPAGGRYLLVACDSSLTLPSYPTTKASCLADADVFSRVIAWTANDMTDCSSTCSPPPPSTCAGGEEE